MSKLLVIDKSVFHKSVLHKDFAEQIFEFVQNHKVVFPHALIAECLMSENKSVDLLRRFVECVKCGGVIGWGSPSIFQHEKQSHNPTVSIINEHETQKARESNLCTDEGLLKSEARLCQQHYKPHIDWLRKISKAFFSNVKTKKLIQRFIGESPNNCQLRRLKDYVDAVDTSKSKFLSHFVPYLSQHTELDWFTWHLIRLHFAWGLEWTCKRVASGVSFERFDISNDFWDIEYVVSLSRADGLLSADSRLVRPLAKSAYPEKDVFSCLEEVTEDYRC
ncbi:MAG: hypothetical protein WBL85_07940 [Sedimentisphaerales bacterium]